MAATADENEATDETTAAPGPQAAERRRRPGRIAQAVSVFGELLITLGVLLGLFVVYSLWWTNVLADRKADRQADEVRRHWAQQKDSGPGALDTKEDRKSTRLNSSH